ncbi:hypothetical protein [Haematobacter genomosp. 1]|uniref:hypothetical protein n=1 Tax=Haematobacter genomosp. 1 TaxID=366618 RepID=UPI0015C65E35|nr:hypothetical protein [Haematobacter genomosp. 1]
MADSTTYRLQSSPACHTPGVIAWAINGYAFEADRPQITRYIADVFPSVPRQAVEQLLTKAVPFTIEDEAVVFTVEETAPVMPTLTCRKCSVVNPLVYFGPVTVDGVGTCVCFACAKARLWLDQNGDLRHDIQV